MSSEIDRTQHEVEAHDIELVGGEGQNDKLGVRLEATPAGALVPRSMRPEETEGLTFGAGELEFTVVIRRADARQGDLVKPLGELDGQAVVGQVLALGNGALLLTDQRAIGLVWQSTASAPNLAAKINDDASGSVIVFTVARSLLSRHKLDTGFGGKIKSAGLIGDSATIHLGGPLALLDSGGKFYPKPHKHTLREALQRFSEG